MKIEYKNKLIACTSKSTLQFKKLLTDLRKCFTPSSRFIKSVPFNKPKEYILLADQYKISHFIFLSQTDVGCYIKFFNYLNRGPTYTFKIISYLLASQLGNGFGEGYTKEPLFLCSNDIKLEFINSHFDVEDVERVVILNKEEDDYFFRHFMVNKDNDKIRLVEIGPRIDMELYKIEDGIMEGEVIYNKYVHKSEEEVIANKIKIKDREDLKLQRRMEQERNVENKKKINLKFNNAEENSSNEDSSKDLE
ncbi:hypothetical protein GVAV_000056 [Gurleya vavrai]